MPATRTGRKSIRGGRRLARELVVQALYRYDLAGGQGMEAVEQIESMNLELTAGGSSVGDDDVIDWGYFRQSTIGVLQRRDQIDQWIAGNVENWSPERLSLVDRNILRLGIYELMVETEIPPRVLINEAIELSKRFGGDDTSRFVNGMMDRASAQLRGEPSGMSRFAEEVQAGMGQMAPEAAPVHVEDVEDVEEVEQVEQIAGKE
jgi:N utilization substance protein B